jgi:hypothetical protein
MAARTKVRAAFLLSRQYDWPMDGHEAGLCRSNVEVAPIAIHISDL